MAKTYVSTDDMTEKTTSFGKFGNGLRMFAVEPQGTAARDTAVRGALQG